MPPAPPDLREIFGEIDVYLFDLLLRGHVPPGATVLDAGCGHGRNLVWLLGAGYDVLAADADPDAVASVRALVAHRAPHLAEPAHGPRVRCEPVEAMSFPDAVADLVLSSAVLHFARDAAHFHRMLLGTWRTVRPGGLLFCRLASRDGVADAAVPLGEGRYGLPDGSERFLVDAATLHDLTGALGGTLATPLRTTVVHGRRAMATWVVRREPA